MGRPAGSARGCRSAAPPCPRSASASFVAMRVSSVTGPPGRLHGRAVDLRRGSRSPTSPRPRRCRDRSRRPPAAARRCARARVSLPACVEPALDRGLEAGRQLARGAAGRAGRAGRSATRARPRRATRRTSGAGPPPTRSPASGPTQASTGTSRSATRWASATPSSPRVPEVSSCSTTTAPSRSACDEPVLEVGAASCGRSDPRPAARRRRGLGGAATAAREHAEQCGEHDGRQGHATHAPIVPAGSGGYPGRNRMPASSVPRRPDPRPISDRAAFKPLAVAAARARDPAGERAARDRDRAAVRGRGARRHARRREALDARRRLHPHPALPRTLHDLRERRQDRARHGLPRQPRAHPPEGREHGGEERRARDRGCRVLRARRAQLELARARPDRERPGRRGRAGRVHDHPAARGRHARRRASTTRASRASSRSSRSRSASRRSTRRTRSSSCT